MRFGCLTRPWNNLPVETCFDGIAAAGYDCIGLLGRPDGPIVGGETPAAKVDEIRGQLAERKLEPLVVWSRSGTDLAILKKEIENVKRLGAGTLLHCGVAKETEYRPFYKMLKEGAAIAEQAGIKLAIKPHGGVTTSAEDCLTVLEEVGHKNLVLWYDPGNIRYYDNLDPVEELIKLAGRLAGCCVKDCTGSRPTGDGKVMMTPGDGELDLVRVFAKMSATRYNGPNMVECLSGTSPDELVEQARIARKRMLEWFV